MNSFLALSAASAISRISDPDIRAMYPGKRICCNICHPNACIEGAHRKNCAQINRKNQQGTWISDEIIASYTLLHQQSIAKSIEVWQNENLVGGFYGIEVGSVFCGESMFSKVSNASKAAFIYFVEKYKNKYQIIDCQVHTNHLESLGARMISKQEYLHFLKTKT